MYDKRLENLVNLLVDYSINCKKGEKVLIEAKGIDSPLVELLVRRVFEKGAYPFVDMIDNRVERALLLDTNEEHLKLRAKYSIYRMDEMDCYIGIRGGNNCFENSDVSAERLKEYNKFYSLPVHHERRVKKTKWVILRYPNEGMAQLANMSTEKFEDYFFNVCTLDYSKMDKAMDKLKELMIKTDRVRLVSPGTDLTFSIKGIGAKKCSGHMNIPDGECYSAPVKDSVNGVITFNAPTVYGGIKHENVRLVFKNGKIIEATSSNTEALNKVLDTDEGSRYVGEFSLGINPFITSPILDILFDEKICGSIHFTPGSCYDDCYNGNESSVHWDMVLIQTKEYGGGEIYFDNSLIRKDGIFVVDELKMLNPEQLK